VKPRAPRVLPHLVTHPQAPLRGVDTRTEVKRRWAPPRIAAAPIGRYFLVIVLGEKTQALSWFVGVNEAGAARQFPLGLALRERVTETESRGAIVRHRQL
jgi:hypothetical protein